MKLRGALKHLLIVLGSAILGFICGFMAAIATAQFWGWFEAKTGIESLGHSGPADWVFEFIIALCSIFFFVFLEWTFRRKPAI
jgi:hypothetical protein